MSLQVHVDCATDIPNPEKFGKCDPYATVEFQGKHVPLSRRFPFLFLRFAFSSSQNINLVIVVCVKQAYFVRCV